MRALLTGIGGFVGAHLAAELGRRGYAVDGVLRGPRRGVAGAPDTAEQAGLIGAGKLFRGDVTRYPDVKEAVRVAAPDVLYHLAGMAYAPEAESSPVEAFKVNVVGTINVLKAAREFAPSCRLLVVSSGDAYGAAAVSPRPLTEDMPLKPVSTYGISKAAAEMAALSAHWNFGQDVIIVRPFNHTGPGQSPRFVCPAFARQLAEIEAGMREPVVLTGDLGAVRDFSDVRDVVEAYVELAEAGTPPEAYNICSGKGVRVGEILEELVSIAGITVEVRESRKRLRPRRVDCLVGSHEKASDAFGWRPSTEFRVTLKDLLSYWRRAVREMETDGGVKLT